MLRVFPVEEGVAPLDSTESCVMAVFASSGFSSPYRRYDYQSQHCTRDQDIRVERKEQCGIPDEQLDPLMMAKREEDIQYTNSSGADMLFSV